MGATTVLAVTVDDWSERRHLVADCAAETSTLDHFAYHPADQRSVAPQALTASAKATECDTRMLPPST